MQTFLIHSSFVVTAKLLDNKRLGKQRVEAKQILNALHGKSKGWRNHPATLMWYGYENALKYYHDCMVSEWLHRGFRNSMPLLYVDDLGEPRTYWRESDMPHWWSDDDILRKIITSHQSNLMRKDSKHYRPAIQTILSGNIYHGKSQPLSLPPDNLPYYWPVTKEEVEAKRVLEFCS